MFVFWVFLMRDLVLFALPFATFGTMIGRQAGGPGPHTLYDIGSAATETGALLLSSFSFGMASLGMKHGHHRALMLFWLTVTLPLGVTFLGFESHDFVSMIGRGRGAQSRLQPSATTCS